LLAILKNISGAATLHISGKLQLPRVTTEWVYSLFAKKRQQALTRYKTFIEEVLPKANERSFIKAARTGDCWETMISLTTP